eukprot:8724345-Heterocapsa_arctica.AAC.1
MDAAMHAAVVGAPVDAALVPVAQHAAEAANVAAPGAVVVVAPGALPSPAAAPVPAAADTTSPVPAGVPGT